MFSPAYVKLKLSATHDDQEAPLGATVWCETVAEAEASKRFLEAMDITVVGEVRETQIRFVPLEGWQFEGAKR